MTAANLGARVTGSGFAVFLVGSLAWLATGLLTGQPALTWTNAVLTLLNIFGIWRWLGRQASVEEGGEAAAEASAKTPGRGAVPGFAALAGGGADRAKLPGNCIDALAGCRSGRIDYVVVSEGGVAGVGETLRRVPWQVARVEGDDVVMRTQRRAVRAPRSACSATDGRRADRYRGVRRSAISPGSRACGERITRRSATVVPAHLTMFHALPPSAERELRGDACGNGRGETAQGHGSMD